MIFTRILLFSIVLIALVLSVALLYPNNRPTTNRLLKVNMRTQITPQNLVFDHVFWARNWVVASLQDDNQQANVANLQVINNAETISEIIELIYGKPAAEQLLGLLISHWEYVKTYSKSHAHKNELSRKEAARGITQNAEELAFFLSEKNTNFPLNQLKSILCRHGRYQMEQINLLQGGKYSQEANTWRAMTKNLNVIVDSVATALHKPLPRKPIFFDHALPHKSGTTSDVGC